MPHSSLRSAGTDVHQSTALLSDHLATVERAAFAEIAYHFTALEREAQGAVLRSGNIYVSLDSALEASVITAHTLINSSVSAAVDAVRRELAILGDVVDIQRADLIAEELATVAASSAIDRAIQNYQLPHDWIRRAFAYQLRQQVLRARDQAEVVLRLFSPRPIAGMGLGVWYKPVGWLQAEARANSIAAVNIVKSEAIYRMNEAVQHG